MWKYPFFLWVVAAHAAGPIEAILTDIEGTTTSVSFVHDILFPYAKEHVGDFLRTHQNESAVSELIDDTARLSGLSQIDLPQVTELLLRWMEQDKKITPLKTLQGMIWKAGYEEGHFQGHVYLDAFQQLQRWHEQGLALYVYSSGSIPAQKLLFSHSTYGDLTPFFSGYFDTKIGGKKESLSYRKIAEAMGLSPSKILFLSDSIEELNAALDAGMQTLLIVRDRASLPVGCPHPIAANFHQVFY